MIEKTEGENVDLKQTSKCSVNEDNEFKTMMVNRLNNDLYKFFLRHIINIYKKNITGYAFNLMQWF